MVGLFAVSEMLAQIGEPDWVKAEKRDTRLKLPGLGLTRPPSNAPGRGREHRVERLGKRRERRVADRLHGGLDRGREPLAALRRELAGL